MQGNKSKIGFVGLWCLTALFVGQPAFANSESTEVQYSKRDIDVLGGHACEGASGNDFETFIVDMETAGLEMPNAGIYGQAICGNGNLILQNTLLPHSTLFLKRFVVAVYKKYGKEEVAKIINMRERRFGYTLLEEAIVQNSCSESNLSSNIFVIISYLKKVGGEMRPGFISECKAKFD